MVFGKAKMTTPKNDPLVDQVKKTLEKAGLEPNLKQMVRPCRTALEAAEAIDCQLGQIAKSMIFKLEISGQPILVIASGINQVDPLLLGKKVNGKVHIASPDFVLEKTGYQIGGVPPVGHLVPFFKVFMDQDLFRFREIWASAGNPNLVFAIPPDKLKEVAQAEVIKVT